MSAVGRRSCFRRRDPLRRRKRYEQEGGLPALSRKCPMPFSRTTAASPSGPKAPIRAASSPLLSPRLPEEPRDSPKFGKGGRKSAEARTPRPSRLPESPRQAWIVGKNHPALGEEFAKLSTDLS